jgi:hypothetical protein
VSSVAVIIGHLGEVPLPEDLGVFGREPGALEEQPVLQAPPVLELRRPSKAKRWEVHKRQEVACNVPRGEERRKAASNRAKPVPVPTV